MPNKQHALRLKRKYGKNYYSEIAKLNSNRHKLTAEEARKGGIKSGQTRRLQSKRSERNIKSDKHKEEHEKSIS